MCIGGDFNVILHLEEELGGLPHRNSRSLDFAECIDSCGMLDVGFNGSRYTWCNNWRPNKRIWMRLDRVFINDDWATKYANNSVRHLARIGPDHRSLLFKCENGQVCGPKYFKFLDFWTTQNYFLEVVRMDWSKNITENPMWILQNKLKSVAKRLSAWSREEISDAKIKWFEEGDTNSKYFHFVIRDRKRRLEINRIKNKNGKWISGDSTIAKAAINHFEHMFNLKARNLDPRILDCIPTYISQEDSDLICSCTQEAEIKSTIFYMSSDSAAGPDGFSVLRLEIRGGRSVVQFGFFKVQFDISISQPPPAAAARNGSQQPAAAAASTSTSTQPPAADYICDDRSGLRRYLL
ncbi:uncharacterized protein LOC132624268 [Lycium barbarum]|uniref:uncharacterized protein LOC132624268 n=1 Tax=Lycium barbarum TaxID=112863 RepID=UPI00293F563F|nr:uncharacterized protein LOC132624268 [Lycium barbarum]